MTSNLKIIGVFAVHSPCRVLGYSLPNPYRQHNGKVINKSPLQVTSMRMTAFTAPARRRMRLWNRQTQVHMTRQAPQL